MNGSVMFIGFKRGFGFRDEFVLEIYFFFMELF